MKLSVKLLASAGLLSLALASSHALAAADEKLRAAAEQARHAREACYGTSAADPS